MKSNALIKPTEFEELVQGYGAQAAEVQRELALHEETHPNSLTNLQRRDVIAKQVQKAYLSLRNVGKPYTIMTISEFEIAQKEVRRAARIDKDKLEELVKKTSSLRFIRRIRLEKKLFRANLILDYGYDVGGMNNTFSTLKDFVNHNEIWRRQLPPNFKELVEEIWQQRFGRKS